MFPDDINDNYPVFVEETLTASVDENRTEGMHLWLGCAFLVGLSLLALALGIIYSLAIILLVLDTRF